MHGKGIVGRMVRRMMATALMIIVAAAGADAKVIKFATLLPQGAPGDEDQRKIFSQLEKDSGGEIKVQIYAGGVAGDESDVIRKMRSNLIQMGAFTGNGLGQIFLPVRVMEVPNFFMTYGEEDYVKQKLFPELAQGFEKNGFILLGLGGAGFVHVFSKYNLTSMDMIKTLKIWTWKGDPLAEICANSLGGNITPLHISDVNTGLQTGMIDTFYITTMGCTALQWYSHARYMLNYPVTIVSGGMLINKKAFDGLSPKSQALLRKTIWDQVAEGNNMIREYNAKSTIQLKDAGITFIDPNKEMIDFFNASGERSLESCIKAGIFSRELYNKAVALRNEYRKTHPEETWQKNVQDMHNKVTGQQ